MIVKYGLSENLKGLCQVAVSVDCGVWSNRPNLLRTLLLFSYSVFLFNYFTSLRVVCLFS